MQLSCFAVSKIYLFNENWDTFLPAKVHLPVFSSQRYLVNSIQFSEYFWSTYKCILPFHTIFYLSLEQTCTFCKFRTYCNTSFDIFSWEVPLNIFNWIMFFFFNVEINLHLAGQESALYLILKPILLWFHVCLSTEDYRETAT